LKERLEDLLIRLCPVVIFILLFLVVPLAVAYVVWEAVWKFLAPTLLEERPVVLVLSGFSSGLATAVIIQRTLIAILDYYERKKGWR